MYGLTEPSVLTILMQSGYSALKTPSCYVEDTKNVNCPACTTFLHDFGQSLPLSHRESSYLVCRITGDIMDENNYPMVLPNGQIYCKNVLEKMADENDGVIHCIKTGFICKFSDLKKVFIL